MAFCRTFYKKILPTILTCVIMSLFGTANSFAQDYFGLTNFPDSSRITSLAVTSGGKLLASMWGVGIYSTTDNGVHWKISTTGLSNRFVTKLHIAETGKVYASTMGGGVFTSSNNGDSWVSISGDLPNLNIKTVMVHPSGTIFAGAYGGGIYISSDNGINWLQTFKGLRYRDVSNLITSGNGYIIAGTFGGGIYFSLDTGRTWRESSGVKNKFITDFVMNKAGDLFASTNGRAIIISANNGFSWSDKDSNEFKDMNINAVTVNSDQELIAGTISNGIYFYDKVKFEKWTATNIFSMGITALTNDKNGNLYAAVAGSPILKSIDKGRTWDEMNGGIREKITQTVAKDGLIAAYTDHDGIRTSQDNGLTWPSYFPSTTPETTTYSNGIIDNNPNIFVASSLGLFLSADFGQSYTSKINEQANSITCNNAGIIMASTILPGQTPIVSVWRSFNSGATFDKLQFIHGQILIMRYSPDGHLYATTPENRLYVSTDNGDTWVKLHDFPEKVLTLAFNSHNDIFCGTTSGVYLSINAGQTWTLKNLGFLTGDNSQAVTSIAVNKEDVIFASVKYKNYMTSINSGIWRSFNNGVTWDSVNASVIVSPENNISVDSEGNLLMNAAGLHKALNPSILGIPAMVTPVNGANDLNVLPVYKWKKAANAELYQVEISLKDDFTFVMDNATIGDTTFNAEYQLSYNTKYYWHVRSKVHSAVSPWSATMSFTTKLPAPILLSPKSDATGVTVEPVMMWYEVTDAKYYKIQIASDKDFSKIVYAKDSILLTDQKAGKLAGLTEYWWRAMCYNDNSKSDWSSAWKFKTTLASPDLIKPDSAAMEVAIKPVFLWHKANTAQKYYIQISTNADFSSAINDSVSGDTTYTNATLDYNKLYYWRVKSQGPVGNSDWSGVWPFTTAIAPPVLVTPASNATAVDFNPVLDWDAVPLADHYHFQVATDSEFKDIVSEKTIGDTTQANIGPLDSYTEYFWRTQAKIGARTGLWSEIRSFKTNLSTVLLRTPGNNTTSHPTEINMQWFPKNGATYYFLQVSKEENFNDLIISKDSITSLSYIYPNFDKSTKYFWRVKVWNNDGTSEWSEVWNFTTGTNSPVLRLPENSAVDVPVNIRFVWDQMGGMTKYHIQIAKNDIFDSPMTDNQELSSAEFKPENLEKSTLYYWRVRAFNGSIYTDWSTVWSFTTGSGSSVDEEPIISLGVYPNPFTNGFTIDYKNDNPGLVRTTLIDALGNTVSILGNEYQLPGLHSIKFSDNVPVGSYFIRLECGSKYSMVKLVKIK